MSAPSIASDDISVCKELQHTVLERATRSGERTLHALAACWRGSIQYRSTPTPVRLTSASTSFYFKLKNPYIRDMGCPGSPAKIYRSETDVRTASPALNFQKCREGRRILLSNCAELGNGRSGRNIHDFKCMLAVRVGSVYVHP